MLAPSIAELAISESALPGLCPSCESASSVSSRIAIFRDGSREVLDLPRLRPASNGQLDVDAQRTVVRFRARPMPSGAGLLEGHPSEPRG